MEDFISMSIKELTDYLEECDPFSEEAMNIHDALFSKVESEILRCFDAASMPCFRFSDTVILGVHPSSKSQESMIQVTRHNSIEGIVGDSQYNSLASAIRSEGLWFRDMIAPSDAEVFLAKVMKAESEYQERVCQMTSV